ncbi:MAG: hypothetical protein ACLFQB_15805 [Chitinispirillaceae bacterium]
MICRILSFPFWLLSRFIAASAGAVKMVFSLLISTFVFLLNHLIGTVFGALIGLLLGRRHVGVKLFTHKRKLPALGK